MDIENLNLLFKNDILHHKQRLKNYFLSGELPVLIKPDIPINIRETKLRTITSPVSLFYLEPSFAKLAYELNCELYRVLMETALFSAFADKKLNKRKTLKLLHQTTLHWMKKHSLENHINYEEQDGVLTKFEMNKSTCLSTGKDLEFELVFDIDGKETQPIQFNFQQLPEVHEIITRLRGWTNTNQLVSSQLTDKILNELIEVNALYQPHKVNAEFSPKLSTENDIAVTPIGHACCLIDCNGKRILIDPWLFTKTSDQNIKPFEATKLGNIDAIFITHHHCDHMDFNTLMQLPSDIPVFVPKTSTDKFGPHLKRYLLDLGFMNVTELSNHDTHTFSNGLKIMAIPFFGEGLTHYEVPALSYLISHSQNNVLFLADSSPDHKNKSIISDDQLKKIVEKYGAIPLIFGSYWQELSYLCMSEILSVFYESIQPENWLDHTDQATDVSQYITDLMSVTHCELFVSYAENGSDEFLPDHLRSKHLDALKSSWPDLEEVQNQLLEQQCLKMERFQLHKTYLISDGRLT